MLSKSTYLIGFLVLGGLRPPVYAQASPAPEVLRAADARLLKILVLEGQNAFNYIPQGRAVPPVIEVRDQNDMPIDGAEVTFELPAFGPGGTYENGVKTQVGRTDTRGQIGANPIQLNSEPGRMAIKVSASYKGLTGLHLVSQTNSSTPAKAAGGKPWSTWSRRKLYIVGGCALGALAGGVYALSRGGSPAPISVSPGPPVFGSPR